ncbi:MAG: permease prefix domain 1-containing protein [Paludibaculum sp.]
MKYFLERLRSVFRHSAEDGELQEELRAHAALLEEEHVQRGRSVEEARRLARLELGSAAALREEHAEVRGVPFLDTLRRDVQYALRSLRRDSGFTAFALLIGTLGIGACTAIFGIVNALLLRDLPVQDPGSLVWVAKENTGVAGDRSNVTVPVNPFIEFRRENKSFRDMAAYFAFYAPGDRKLTGTGEPERLTAIPVSNNFFRLLGVAPKLGREMSERGVSDECAGCGAERGVLEAAFRIRWRNCRKGDHAGQ